MRGREGTGMEREGEAAANKSRREKTRCNSFGCFRHWPSQNLTSEWRKETFSVHLWALNLLLFTRKRKRGCQNKFRQKGMNQQETRTNSELHCSEECRMEKKAQWNQPFCRSSDGFHWSVLASKLTNHNLDFTISLHRIPPFWIVFNDCAIWDSSWLCFVHDSWWRSMFSLSLNVSLGLKTESHSVHFPFCVQANWRPLIICTENLKILHERSKCKSVFLACSCSVCYLLVSCFLPSCRSVKLLKFHKFADTNEATAAACAMCEGILPKGLKKFLKHAIVKADLRDQLAVIDARLGSLIKEQLEISCVTDGGVQELIRGIRNQASSLIAGLTEAELNAMRVRSNHASLFPLNFSCLIVSLLFFLRPPFFFFLIWKPLKCRWWSCSRHFVLILSPYLRCCVVVSFPFSIPYVESLFRFTLIFLVVCDFCLASFFSFALCIFVSFVFLPHSISPLFAYDDSFSSV